MLRIALGRTLDRLRRGGRRVVLLGDVPGFRFDPARESRTAFLPVRRMVGRLLQPDFATHDGQVSRRFVSPIDDIGNRIVAQVAGKSHTTYARLADGFCDPLACRFQQADIPLFIDPQHLSRPGAQRVVRRIGPMMWDMPWRRRDVHGIPAR